MDTILLSLIAGLLLVYISFWANRKDDRAGGFEITVGTIIFGFIALVAGAVIFGAAFGLHTLSQVLNFSF